MGTKVEVRRRSHRSALPPPKLSIRALCWPFDAIIRSADAAYSFALLLPEISSDISGGSSPCRTSFEESNPGSKKVRTS